MNHLIDAFNEYFEIVPANTPELKAETFRLRYEVICEEIEMPGYEKWKYPSGQETDEEDSRSSHCLLRHRPTGAAAGTVRLILSDPHNAEEPLPIEKQLQPLFSSHAIEIPELPRGSTVEVSRFILAKRFRSRKGEDRNESGVGDRVTDRRKTVRSENKDRRQFPHAVLGLMVAMLFLASQQRVTHWYAIMEPILNRLLRRFALEFTPIGPVINYHGLRQPHLDPVVGLLTRTYKRRPDVWELVTDEGKLWPDPGV